MKTDTSKFLIPGAIVVVALAVFFSGGTNIGSITVDNDLTKTITASGDAKVSVAPDLVTVSFGVETEGATASESQTANSLISNKITSTVSSFGIPSGDVKTTQLSVYPLREWNPETGEQIDAGFRTTHIITVETSKTEIAGELIDAVVKAGANRVDNIRFSLQEETEEQLRAELLDDAAKEARVKAESVARGLGTSVIGVSSASESSFGVSPFYARAESFAFDEGIATQVSQGEVEVSANVNVAFEIA